MARPPLSFGEKVRSLREAKGVGLRQFATLVGMSPTYLSKIERGELVPPTEEKIRAIARQIGADEDEFLVLAGRIPADLSEIIRRQPRALPAFLRTAKGLTSSNIEDLTDRAARMKKSGEARPRRTGASNETNE